MKKLQKFENLLSNIYKNSKTLHVKAILIEKIQISAYFCIILLE